MNQTNRHSPHYGQLLMAAACLCFSLGGVLCKLIPWNALAINGARNLVSAVLVGVYLLLRRHRLRWNAAVLFGAVCYMGVTSLFIVANKLTTAANAIILQYTAPIWIILFMALLFHTRPTRLELGTVAVVLAGILCFFFDSLARGNVLGDLAAVGAGIFYAGMFLLNSFPRGDALSSLFFGQLFSGLCFAPLTVRETDFSPTVLLAVFVLGAVQVGLAYIFFCEGTRYTPPVTASLIAAIEPILNPTLVALFWGELMSPLSLLGAAVVIAAVVIYNVKKGNEGAKRAPDSSV